MTTFDSADYRKRVLKIYSSTKLGIAQKALRELREGAKIPSELDLLEFYDVNPSWGADLIVKQIHAVADDLRKASNSPVFQKYGKIFVEIHNEIEKRNQNLNSREFWAVQVKNRIAAGEAALSAFGKAVSAELGPLQVITDTRLRELARVSNVPDSVSDTDLAKYIAAAGGSVVDKVPKFKEPSSQDLKDILSGVERASSRSILSAVFFADGEPTRFAVLDGFRSIQNPSLKVSSEAVDRSQKRSKTKKDGNLTSELGKVIDTIKRAVGEDEAALQDLIVAYFIEYAKRLVSVFPLQLQALDAFVDRTGIVDTDAKRILLHVAEGKPRVSVTYPDVQAKVMEGAIMSARRMYDALIASTKGAFSTEQNAALAALEAAENRLEKLRSEGRDAQLSGDSETARKAFRKALVICSDDPNLKDDLQRLPPPAPCNLTASAVNDGRHVYLSWDAPDEDGSEMRFHVVRRIGCPPTNSRDGTQIARDIARLEYIDAQPPIAASLYYGIWASSGGNISSVATTKIELLPAVSDTRVSSEPTSISLRWTAPPEVRAVEVIQVAPDGVRSKLPVIEPGLVTSGGLITGATYTYLITAIYVRQDGLELKSEAVRKTGVPRGRASAIVSFSLTDRSKGSSAEIEASWEAVPGFPVEVWHFARQPSWAVHEVVPISEIRRLGTQLTGPKTETGLRQSVCGIAGHGLRYYIPVTLDGETAHIGQMRSYGTCPALSNVLAERFNDEVQLRWEWPGSEYDVLVSWETGNGKGERTLTHSEYLSNGCRVLIGFDGAVFNLYTIADNPDGQRWRSPPTRVEVLGSEVVLHWDIEFRRNFLRKIQSALLRFSGKGSEKVDVVVVCAYGRIMPYDESQGTVLAKARVKPSENSTIDVQLTQNKGPLWVRVFSKTPGVRLVDPLSSKMRID